MTQYTEYTKLEAECKKRGYDLFRMLQLAAALKFMIVKYRLNKWGRKEVYLTCYKSKNSPHRWEIRHREKF